MQTRPKSCGPSRRHAFRRIARRGVPFTAVGDCAFIALPAQSFGYHSSRRAFLIDRFASQNFQPSPQPKAENRFTPTREMHPAPGLCVTTPDAGFSGRLADLAEAAREEAVICRKADAAG